MKGRALSFESLADLCGMDRALTTASAFKRGALSHSATVPPRTWPPNVLMNGEARLKSSNSGELGAPKGSP